MNEVEKTLEQRGNIYGDYHSGVELRAMIMDGLKKEYRKNHNNAHMPKVYEGYLWDQVNKLIRLAVSPNHIDSWHDIQGYAQLVEKALIKNGDGK